MAADIDFRRMKKVEAVIVPLHSDAVRKELERCGIGGGLTVVDVQQSDSEKRLLRTATESFGALQDRVKLELVLEDSEAEKAVNVILRHAQPECEDQAGQISILEVNEFLRIGGR